MEQTIAALGDRLREAAAGALPWAFERVAAFWSWLRAQGPEQAIGLAVFLGLFFGLRVLRAFLSGVLRARKAPDHAIRNIVSALIGGTWSPFLLLVSAAAVAPFMPNLPDALAGALPKALQAAVILQGAVWLRILIKALIGGYMSARATGGGALLTAMSLITTLSGIVIWTFAIIMVLNSFGIEVGPLIAGLGVGGLAIGLAAQNIFRDLFSSLSIVFDQPFSRGDFISFNDGRFLGRVERIGMKTTRLRSLTGEQIIVSNSMILDKEIRNFQRMDARRAAHDLGVLYQTPHEKLRDIPRLVEAAVNAVAGARFDRCHLKAYGASAIVFEAVFWAETDDYRLFMDVQQGVLMNIHRAFEHAGVAFAYPTQTLYVRQEAGPALIDAGLATGR